jgi:hypothetical protein
MIDQLLQLGVTNFNLTILLLGKNVQPVADYTNQTNCFELYFKLRAVQSTLYTIETCY